MFGFFKSSRGFESVLPTLAKEMHNWAEAGLIPGFGPSSLVEDSIVNMLRAVREHLTDG